MYNIPYYKEPDQTEIIAFMRQHPFILLSGVDADNKPVATQVPVFIDEKEGKLFLTGHIMKNTDHHLAFEKNNHVLAIFTGAHTYVSATWYTNPHMGSTWNYMSVYAYGRISYGEGEELATVLQRLTLHYEKNNPASATVFNNLSKEYTEKMIKAIVAFEIEVTNLQHVFKLSQNRDEESYNHIIHQLKKGDENAKAVAAVMEKRKAKVFSHE
jgi:transcriptional regulator